MLEGGGLMGRRAGVGGDPGEPFESIVALRERTEGDITAACGTVGWRDTLPCLWGGRGMGGGLTDPPRGTFANVGVRRPVAAG